MKLRLPAAALLGFALVLLVGCTAVRTRVWMNEGNKLYKAQRWDEAITEYKKIIAIDPENWPANYQIAMSYLVMFHPGSTHPKDIEYAEQSTLAFEKLLTLKAPDDKTSEKVRNFYVALLVSAEKTDKVVAYYNGLLQKEPRNVSLMSQLAQIYQKKGDFANAVKYHQMRLEIEPSNKETWYTIGVLCWARGKELGPTLSNEEQQQTIDTGLKALEKALALDANYFDALVYAGLIYRQQSSLLAAQMKNEDAGEAFNKAEEFRKRAEVIGKQRMAATASKKGA